MAQDNNLAPEAMLARLNELLVLDRDAGLLRWKVSRGHLRAGSVAGAVQSNGYIRIQIDRRFYAAHRLVWLIAHGRWPKNDIDHINRNRTDNRPENLREATRSENLMNTSVRCDSRTGVKGVRIKRGKYQARIKVGGVEVSLGTFDSLEEAEAVRKKAANDYHGAFGMAA